MTALPEAYLSPDTYLQSSKFHLTHTFTPTTLSTPLTVSYALCGSTSPSAPLLLWINGLGHHRLASALFDGICAEKGVRLLTIDRPSSGRSTPLVEPYSSRVEVVYATILSVLEKHSITEFSLLSHSNGIIYSLYLLRNLPLKQYTCLNWALTSPWIPPSISGSLGLSIASYLPVGMTSKLGGLVQGVEKLIGPVGWSYGIARDWVGWSAGLIASPGTAPVQAVAGGGIPNGTSSTSTTTPPRKRTPKEQIESFETLQSLKPIEERTFGGRYFPSGLLDKGMKIAIEEGLEGMGVEAVMSLRGKGVEWKWLEEEGGVTEHELYERGCGRLKEKLVRENWDLKLRVWCAGEDGMIPKKGRDWFKELMVGNLCLVEEENWREVKKAGHDEILGLEFVIEELLSNVKRVA